MIGAILGDMIGSPYEFDMGNKTKEFPLFSRASQFTDDTVMTIAVAEALMDTIGQSDDDIKAALVNAMQTWGKRYPDAGYGGMFYHWLRQRHPKPYGSYGNGSAMRVASAGWLFDTLEETRHMARLTAEVTHNHPEGIKGAEAAASVIFLARHGTTKEDIKAYIIREFGYDFSRTCDEIRPGYYHVETCQQTVPEAITAFMEGVDFEDVIRTAVSLGGDCDTLTCIAGGMAEAFYDIPEGMINECRKRLTKEMRAVIDRFQAICSERRNGFHDAFLDGNELIEDAISSYHVDDCKENLLAVLDAIRTRMHADGHFIFPVVRQEKGGYTFRTIQCADGRLWCAAFTSYGEYQKGAPGEVISHFIDSTLKSCMTYDIVGFIINPWGQPFMLSQELVRMLVQADGDVAYTVPDDEITAELLAGGVFLKRATEICNRNRTQLNLIKLAKILRDSWVWIPCTAVMSDNDYEALEKMFMVTKPSDTLVGKTFTMRDVTRMMPDILQHGDDFFFPVFTSVEEMGAYGEHFSKVEKSFMEAIMLARHNEKHVKGIVINAFSEPFIVPLEMFDFITGMASHAVFQAGEDNV